MNILACHSLNLRCRREERPSKSLRLEIVDTAVSKRQSESECDEVDGECRDRTLPRRADMIVHELFTSNAIAEGVIPTLNDARRRLLSTEGVIVPAACALRGVLVESAAIAARTAPPQSQHAPLGASLAELFVASSHQRRRAEVGVGDVSGEDDEEPGGVDDHADDEGFCRPCQHQPVYCRLHEVPWRPLCRPTTEAVCPDGDTSRGDAEAESSVELLHFDFGHHDGVPLQGGRAIRITATSDGVAHGVACWLQVDFGHANETLENTPARGDDVAACGSANWDEEGDDAASRDHWTQVWISNIDWLAMPSFFHTIVSVRFSVPVQVIYPFDAPVQISHGAELELRVSYDEAYCCCHAHP